MKYLALILLSLLILPTAQAEKLYKYRDKNGTWTYSDRKPDTNYEAIDKNFRGDDAKKSNEEEAAIPAERTMASVQAALDTIKPSVDVLYTEMVKANQDTDGQVVINFAIDNTGKVTECTEDESAMNGTKFEGKICEKITAIDYGPVKFASPLTIAYTYTFTKTTQ